LTKRLAAAYRRDYGEREQEVRCGNEPSQPVMLMHMSQRVVEDVEEPAYELSVAGTITQKGR